MDSSLGTLVEQLRLQMGWNRKELAERAGLHPSHIGLIERSGRVGVRPETLQKIAVAFGVPVARLLGQEESLARASTLEPYRAAIAAAQREGISPEQLLALITTTAEIFAKR